MSRRVELRHGNYLKERGILDFKLCLNPIVVSADHEVFRVLF